MASAASTFSPARPPAIPLAVKSPYLSTWLQAGSDGGNGGYLAGQWPIHWSQSYVGWAGLIKVDGRSYQWMGNIPGVQNVDQTSFVYTSTKSIFTMNVGNLVTMEITFLSPIAPMDLARMSLPFSYLEVKVRSKDGQNHNVQLYSDISAEWISTDKKDLASWSRNQVNNLLFHRVSLQNQYEFGESDLPVGNGIAQWGDVWYATDAGPSVSYQSGEDKLVRGNFIANTSLPNTADSNFRAISDRWPVFGFAKDLGKVSNTPVTTLFTIGMTQRNAVKFLGAKGLVSLPSLWTSQWPNETQALNYFHSDHVNMERISDDVDKKVKADSTAVAGDNYATINSLTVRQSFGALAFAGTKDDQYVFMKEISSNGNMQTVDVVFPMHPILLYFNPQILQLLLKPLFENQESGNYPHKWSIHDIGAHFPNATGHTDGMDEAMPVEECGNMLIMSAAYAKDSGDNQFLTAHYPLLSQWTQFLINDSLVPAEQLSTDDFAGPLLNQTNLALKGIIGIRAMAQIAKLVGKSEESQKYYAIARDYANKFINLGVAWDETPPHTTLNYGNPKTHGLLYNLWCDLELGKDLPLNLSKIYTTQDAFYPTAMKRYGVPLDTRHSWAKADWQIWVAGTVSKSLRDKMLEAFVRFINETTSSNPLTDLFESETGTNVKNIEFRARPVMGATFALLLGTHDGTLARQFSLPPERLRPSYHKQIHYST